jgi:hypothetical protein
VWVISAGQDSRNVLACGGLQHKACSGANGQGRPSVLRRAGAKAVFTHTHGRVSIAEILQHDTKCNSPVALSPSFCSPSPLPLRRAASHTWVTSKHAVMTHSHTTCTQNRTQRLRVVRADSRLPVRHTNVNRSNGGAVGPIERLHAAAHMRRCRRRVGVGVCVWGVGVGQCTYKHEQDKNALQTYCWAVFFRVTVAKVCQHAYNTCVCRRHRPHKVRAQTLERLSAAKGPRTQQSIQAAAVTWRICT